MHARLTWARSRAFKKSLLCTHARSAAIHLFAHACVVFLQPSVTERHFACRVHAAELGKLFVSKANRQLFQRTVSRRTQQALTSVELDFLFPPACLLEAQCEALLRPLGTVGRLSANQVWWALQSLQCTQVHAHMHADIHAHD